MDSLSVAPLVHSTDSEGSFENLQDKTHTHHATVGVCEPYFAPFPLSLSWPRHGPFRKGFGIPSAAELGSTGTNSA